MNLRIKSLVEGSKDATGIVVIIDVLRACTTIPILLKNGAQEIIPTRTAEQAKEYDSLGYTLIGEGEHGHIHDSFHHNNSPSEIYKIDFTGKKIVIRTNNATQAILNAGKAQYIILASFVNLDACTEFILTHNVEDITLVPLGRLGKKGLEDELCAKAIQLRLEGKPIDFRKIKEQITDCETAVLVRDTLKKPKDVAMSLDLNAYPIVPEVYIEKNIRTIRASTNS